MTIEYGALIVGWNRAVSGRESHAAELFGTVTGYYDRLQKSGKITGWEPIFLNNHGGDFNGFFIVRGTQTNLDLVQREDEWVDNNLRASLCLENYGVIPAFVGQSTITEMMTRWTKNIPR